MWLRLLMSLVAASFCADSLAACPSSSCVSPSLGAPVRLGAVKRMVPDTQPHLRSLAAGGVRVELNLAAGCAVWQWWWNDVQFVNDYDYGRQIQVTMFPADGSAALGEAGDAHGKPASVDARHLSPCVTFTASDSAKNHTATTAAIPVEWSPESFGGGVDTPLMYPAVRLGKRLTLDWIGPDGIDRNWPVARFRTIINSPAVPLATIEAPTGYLNSQFNTYYSYDPASRALRPLALAAIQAATWHSTGYGLSPRPGPQAVILAAGTQPSATAMGVYVNDPSTGFVFYDNSVGSSPGQSGSNFVKWEVHYYGPVSAGTWTFDTWITTNRLSNVLQTFDQLYSWHLTSR